MMLKARSHLSCVLSILFLPFSAYRAMSQDRLHGNKPERLECLIDAGLGLFIHWGVDSKTGTVISHSFH